MTLFLELVIILLIVIMLLSQTASIRIAYNSEPTLEIGLTVFAVQFQGLPEKRKKKRSENILIKLKKYALITRLLRELISRSEIRVLRLDTEDLISKGNTRLFILSYILIPSLLAYVRENSLSFEKSEEGENKIDVIFEFQLFSAFILLIKLSYYMLKIKFLARTNDA